MNLNLLENQSEPYLGFKLENWKIVNNPMGAVFSCLVHGPGNTWGNLAIPGITREYQAEQGMPWNTREHQEIPVKIRKYQGNQGNPGIRAIQETTN